MADTTEVAFRPLIAKSLVVCLAVAVAPWLTGGQAPVGMLLSAFALLMGVVLVWLQPESPEFKRGPLLLTFGALMVLAGLSLLWTANQFSTALWIAQWLLAGLAFRLAYAISGDDVGRKWLVGAYAWSAGLFSVVAIGMYLTSEYGRLTGTFYWANPAAAYLIPAIVWGADRMRRNVGRRQYAWMAYTVLTGASFLLADSRAATVVLVIVLAFYLLLTKLSWRHWILFLFTLVLAFGLSFGLAKLSTITAQSGAKLIPGSRFSEAIKGESTSGSDRLFYLKSAGLMLLDHPLGGVGAGAYGDVHPQYQQRVVSASTSAHNAYAQIVAELGLAGGLLLLALLFVLALGSLRGLINHPELMPLALGTLGLLMHFGLDIDARYPALLMLVGVFFGLLWGASAKKWVAPSWKWFAVAVLALIPIVSVYFGETWAERARVIQSDGDYELAAEDFSRATGLLIVNPDIIGAEGINEYALAGLGGTDRAGHIAAALALAKRAQAADPHDGQHYQLEGRILSLKGDFKGAEAAFRRALVLDPFNHPDYAQDLAGVLAKQKRTEEAIAVAEAMIKQYPGEVLANRRADETLGPRLANLAALVGNIHLQEGRIPEARAAADLALIYDKKSLRGRALKHQVEIATTKQL